MDRNDNEEDEDPIIVRTKKDVVAQTEEEFDVDPMRISGHYFLEHRRQQTRPRR